ncbi:uncharacterized protein LOC118432233 [Branchiostoma floridae]|uniref:Uncharacterized protein LOC118432233 n=1 Tax=Branchiostoma floridae TaxID=7739 RepID=A0A9J7MEE0_BRAFL|nr:uncharacterized protein LOC118432233 [Branchiostoma floridae]
MLNTTDTTAELSLADSTILWPATTIGTTIETTLFEDLMTNDATQGTITAGRKSQAPSPPIQLQQFPIVPVAASLGTVLGLLLLLAVLLFIFCRRRRARSQEDNMTAKLDKDTDQVGMGELGTGQHDDDEHNYHTIQEPAINSKGLPIIPASPSEHDENYSTIPDLLSDRLEERAPAPPPSQTDELCSTGYSLKGGYCYKTSGGNYTAAQARSYCTDEGAIVAEPKSQEEHDYIKSFISETTWIGIADLDDSGSFEYVSDNTSVGFKSLADSLGIGKCMAMDKDQDYNWIRTGCSAEHPVVCQQVPIGNMASTTVFPSFGHNTPTRGPNENKESSTTAGLNSSPRSSNQSQQFPIVAVAAAVGTILGLLLLLAVLLFFICRKRVRRQEDNMTSKPDKDTDQVGMGELGMVPNDGVENDHDYQTIQDPAITSKGLPDIPTAPPSEHDENYSTIPDLLSDRVDERAPAPPPSQTDVYYSVVRDSGTARPPDQAEASDTAKTTQEPEYAVVKKASKRKETKKEESDETIDQGTSADVPEYAVVNKIKKDQKAEGKVNDEYGTVDNVIYQPS